MVGGCLRQGGLFLLFAFAYFGPFLLDASAIAIHEVRVESLFNELVSRDLVRFELLRNLLASLGGLLCIFVLCCWMAVRLACCWRISSWIICLLLLFVAWIGLLAGNAWLFPMSNYSVAFQSVASPLWAVVAGLLLALAFLRALFSLANSSILSVLTIMVLGLIGGGWLLKSTPSQAKGIGRNVIIIGVDSLSANVFEQNQSLLPSLSDLMKHAKRYSRAYTPLGRTFPAWVSILSGKPPAEHGAVFNLRNMEQVDRNGLLSSTLRALGYRTIFAIDERRFANIDESFGFDHVVGPKAGALDFVVQGINDTPLTNILLQTRLAGHLLPYSRLNVASYASYDADGFVGSVLHATDSAGQLFLAVHFESGHFPFKTRHAAFKIKNKNKFLARHLEGVAVVDAQVDQLMRGLARKGFLEDALVVVLSDHGEGLGRIEAKVTRDGQRFDLRSYGHGSNLLSDHQNRTVLGLVHFRGGRPVDGAAEYGEQVSLLDIRSAVEQYVATGDTLLKSQSNCITVETGVRFLAAENYQTLDEKRLVSESVDYYEVDSEGRLRLREDKLPQLLADKDIGLRCSDRITWYSSREGRYFAYALTSQGLPSRQIEPRDADVSKIKSYRQRYLDFAL